MPSPPTNIILNGGFEMMTANWSGMHNEMHYRIDRESKFIPDSTNPLNMIAEMERNAGIAVLRQSFTIETPLTTNLTLMSTLRPNMTPGQEGFLVEIVDSAGGVIAAMTVFPTQVAVYETYTLPVNFTTAGSYTLRFTELGVNNGTGALLDNIVMLVCFAGQTLIETPTGAVPARDIQVGDLVTTERGPMPVRWVGRRRVAAAEMMVNDKLRPVRITAGALGQGLPRADLLVSRQHRMLVSSPICQRMFGQTDSLVSALKLTALPGIHVDEAVAEIDYIHLLFDQHEVVFAEGAPSESLLLQTEALAALSPEAVEEIRLLFPEMGKGRTGSADARLIPKGSQQARLADRMAQNGRPVLESFRRLHT